ncbi:hypothetical protein DNL40_07255 [Xylanimonas oleitrophica]|uniref:Putative zinc-finger domain-containing protein n=1 Tax=Xylanimonas oleitrophica TaxID=2607479 RepID=A0A2W5XTD2_9MICO|nr:zf-HC2 domain-containing protein [Xylanimonas oleitrophica]PZR53318.1 hypothetical protein DNL40_07255 [Xylanimonas oleitrophica]
MSTAPGGHDPADPYREWDAAYVLGALDPAERREYEQHLAVCDACRAALGHLAGLPGLLGAVEPQDRAALLADGVQPTPGGADVVPLAAVASAARRSRARRRSLLVAAGVALVVAGGLGGAALGGGGPAGVSTGPGVATAGPDGGGSPHAASGARDLVLEPVGDTDVRAELTATPTAWGTRLDWRCRYPVPPAGPVPGSTGGTGSTASASGAADEGYGAGGDVTYELVVVDRTGERTVVATWSADSGEADGLGASSAVALADVRRVEIAVGGRPEPLAAATL